MGIEPMLLALAMEFALKAWFVFDFNDPNPTKTHNLLTLFDKLSPHSQSHLEKEYQQRVALVYSDPFLGKPSIKALLRQHANAFTEWRYIHERKKPMSFEVAHFIATLELVLDEFHKRYRVVRIESSPNSDLES